MIDWILALGIHLSNPAELQQDHGYDARVGVETRRGDMYVWGSYDNPQYRNDLGSNMGALEQIGVGVGIAAEFAPKWVIAIEAGKLLNDISPKATIRNEYIKNSLRHDFGPPPFRPGEYRYRLSDAYSVGVRLGYRVRDNLAVTASYRAAKAKEKVDMWTKGDFPPFEIGVEPDCRCWHQQTNSVDLSAFSVGIEYQF